MIAVRTYELPFGENDMLRLIAFALAAYCYLQSGFAMADEAAKQLVGSWSQSERQSGLHFGWVLGIHDR